jgi:hypothetical protein
MEQRAPGRQRSLKAADAARPTRPPLGWLVIIFPNSRMRTFVPGLTGDGRPHFLADVGLISRLHVDLEAEVDFGRRQAAAQAPVFRRCLDQRDLNTTLRAWR